MNDQDIQIRITYKRRDDKTPVGIELEPQEYFDPLEPGARLV